MIKHTPGPWRVIRTASGYDHVRGPNQQRISHECQDLDDLGDEAKANAYLIAAAPDMLILLKICLSAKNHGTPLLYERLAAVIAQAEGEQNE